MSLTLLSVTRRSHVKWAATMMPRGESLPQATFKKNAVVQYFFRLAFVFGNSQSSQKYSRMEFFPCDKNKDVLMGAPSTEQLCN